MVVEIVPGKKLLYEVPEQRSLKELIGELVPVTGDSNAPTLLILFAGQRLGMGISRVAFRKAVADLAVNVVMTPDTAPWWWADDGILAGDPAGMPSVRLREELRRQWPHDRLLCMGYSMGGSIALLAGSLFGAEGVMAFSTLSFVDRWRRLIYRDRRWHSATARTAPALRKARHDMRRVLRNPTYREALLISDPDDRLDALHARRLADIPRTKLRWERGGGHQILRAMYLQGTLGLLLADAVNGRPLGSTQDAAQTPASPGGSPSTDGENPSRATGS